MVPLAGLDENVVGKNIHIVLGQAKVRNWAPPTPTIYVGLTLEMRHEYGRVDKPVMGAQGYLLV